MTPSERQAERRAAWVAFNCSPSRNRMYSSSEWADKQLDEYDERFPITDSEPNREEE